MLAGVAVTVMDCLTDGCAVREHPVKILVVDLVATGNPKTLRLDLLRQDSAGADLEEVPENPAYNARRGFIHKQLPVLDLVAIGWHPARPHSSPTRGSDLVPDALGGHVPFELGEVQEYVYFSCPSIRAYRRKHFV